MRSVYYLGYGFVRCWCKANALSATITYGSFSNPLGGKSSAGKFSDPCFNACPGAQLINTPPSDSSIGTNVNIGKANVMRVSMNIISYRQYYFNTYSGHHTAPSTQYLPCPCSCGRCSCIPWLPHYYVFPTEGSNTRGKVP